ncbi:MAG TPA: hypothetical protein VLJ19_20350 [Variovorax sp.]|nr:hypothetical protein [Variovorax sp.]
MRIAREGWPDASPPSSMGADLDSLKQFAASLRITNWSTTIEAIDLFSAGD